MIAMLSFPRSGSHYTRYLIEFLTGRPTLGCSTNKEDVPMCKKEPVQELNNITGDPVAIKYHDFHVIPSNFMGKLILIIREPIEALVSYRRDLHEYFFSKDVWEDELNSILPFLSMQCDRMRNNFNYFSKFTGSKLLIVYEDLVFNNSDISIKKLINFLDIDSKKGIELLKDTRKYSSDSLLALDRSPMSVSENFYASKMNKENLKTSKHIINNILDDLTYEKLKLRF